MVIIEQQFNCTILIPLHAEISEGEFKIMPLVRVGIARVYDKKLADQGQRGLTTPLHHHNS